MEPLPILRELLWPLAKYSIYIAQGEADAGSVGLVFLVTKAHFAGWEYDVEEIVGGRVAFLRVEGGIVGGRVTQLCRGSGGFGPKGSIPPCPQPQSFRCYAVHHHGLPARQMSESAKTSTKPSTKPRLILRMLPWFSRVTSTLCLIIVNPLS